MSARTCSAERVRSERRRLLAADKTHALAARGDRDAARGRGARSRAARCSPISTSCRRGGARRRCATLPTRTSTREPPRRSCAASALAAAQRAEWRPARDDRRSERVYRGAHAAAGPLLFLRAHAARRARRVGRRARARPARPARPGHRGRRRRRRSCSCSTTPSASRPRPRRGRRSPASSPRRSRRASCSAACSTATAPPVDGLPVAGRRGACARSTARPINPVRRAPPRDFIETGICAIDGHEHARARPEAARSSPGPGLPASSSRRRSSSSGARAPRGEPFAIVFAAIGHHRIARRARSSSAFARAARCSSARVLFLNLADDPTVERLLAPRARAHRRRVPGVRVRACTCSSCSPT